MNTEWKKGYEEGFAAGWKAAAKQDELNHTNFPKVYYHDKNYMPNYTYPVHATMADQSPITYPAPLNETKTEKVIRNLTDHTRIV